MSATQEIVLVRWGEIFLKGQNRSWFERQLVDNARRAIAGIAGARIDRTHGRLIAWPGEGGPRRLVRALERVFGVASVSAALVVPRELDAITQAALERVRLEVGERKPRFKVETRRADKRWQPPSPEVSRLVGGAVHETLGLPVDVHEPELTIGIEIGLENAFIYAGATPGPGGLPVGVSGRVELMLSGGIDSPVAGWLMMKRGCKLGATYFHSFPYTGEKTQDKVQRLAQLLAAWQLDEVRLAVVPFTDAQKKLRDVGEDGRLAVVLYRRMMVRVAERIARAAGAKALATGEALAQVASQTLDNMAAIDSAATEMPILRPCLAHDKQETIAIARRIGTYETSIEPYDDCCSLFTPEHPETRARLADVLALEAKLDLAALVDDCVARVSNIVCRP
jgi:thiamine biosynthesis protein ThiI